MSSAAAVNGGQNPSNAQPQDAQRPSLWSMVQRMLMIWIASQIVTKYVLKPLLPEPQAAPGSSGPAPSAQGVGGPSATTVKENAVAQPIWSPGTNFTLDLYVSTSSTPSDLFAKTKKNDGNILAHITWENINWGNWSVDEVWTGDLRIPTSVRPSYNDTPIWAYIFLTMSGSSPDPYNAMFFPPHVHMVRRVLTKYMKPRKVVKERNLLSSEQESVEKPEPEPEVKLVPYWYRNLTLALVSDAGPIPINQLPPPMAEHVMFTKQNPKNPNEISETPYYYPIVFHNTFWHLQSSYEPLTPNNETLPLRITFSALSYFKFQLYAVMSASFEQAQRQGAEGGGAGASAGAAELDELKRMLLETNPILLVTTFVVSVLHVVFEMLAFTADVGHWRKKEELTGVSVRTIFTNVFIQIVILLYLLDNNEETSWMILFGQGTGALIEAWKITKVLDIKIVRAAPGNRFPYALKITDKHVLSDDEKKTQEYDRLAYRYVSYVAVPLLLGYTIYTLMYQTHKGWYSFVISTLTSFVYTFGFAQLIPQLIINYKLKSVAHLPAKAFVYKFLSTIVDDLFAFCIKMPILHRLACFRDDVVFLIYLYQRWIYRVDPKRVNEYGQVIDAQVIEAEDKTDGDAKEGEEGESKKDK